MFLARYQFCFHQRGWIMKASFKSSSILISHVSESDPATASPVRLTILGNVELNWPKLFHTFSYILTSFFLHKCIHSIAMFWTEYNDSLALSVNRTVTIRIMGASQAHLTDLNNNWTDKLCLNSEAAGCHYLQWKDPHCRAPSWAAVAVADRRKWSLVYWRLA